MKTSSVRWLKINLPDTGFRVYLFDLMSDANGLALLDYYVFQCGECLERCKDMGLKMQRASLIA